MAEARGEALEWALALAKAPAERVGLRQRSLPDGMERLLQVAAGHSSVALIEFSSQTGETLADVVEAARFYAREILFHQAADAYRVLGVAHDADTDTIRTHHRLLQQWLHPDRHTSDWDAIFAARVNAAWSQLRSDQRRQAYDRENPPRHRDHLPTNQGSPTWLHPQPVMGGQLDTDRWRRRAPVIALFAVCGLLAVLAVRDLQREPAGIGELGSVANARVETPPVQLDLPISLSLPDPALAAKPTAVTAAARHVPKPAAVAVVVKPAPKPVAVPAAARHAPNAAAVAVVAKPAPKPVVIAAAARPAPKPVAVPAAARSAPKPVAVAAAARPTAKPVAVAVVAKPMPKPVAVAVVAKPIPKPLAVAVVAKPIPKPVAVAVVAKPIPKPVAVAVVVKPIPKSVAVAVVAKPIPKPATVAVVAKPAPKPVAVAATLTLPTKEAPSVASVASPEPTPADIAVSHSPQAPVLAIQRMRQAQQVGGLLMSYMSKASAATPPIWGSLATQRGASQLRGNMHGAGTVKLDPPHWRMGDTSASMQTAIRYEDGGVGRLSADLAWREQRWLVTGLSVERDL